MEWHHQFISYKMYENLFWTICVLKRFLINLCSRCVTVS